MLPIAESELIINPDGSIFHLHLKPEDIADNVILVGDPGRVDVVAGFFQKIISEGANREFIWKTGLYNNVGITVLSTGIGTDNIDIVLNELDALVNVDFSSRQVKEKHRALRIVRIGTCGSLQKDLPVDTWLLSEMAIGFDGLLNFYQGRDKVSVHEYEEAFVKHTGWKASLTDPYFVAGERELFEQLKGEKIMTGLTVSAPGFYGPQGRVIRLPLAMSEINDKLTSFRFKDRRIMNYEMECSAIYGLSKLLGHQAATVCVVIANRLAGTYSKDYKNVIKELIEYVLNILTK